MADNASQRPATNPTLSSADVVRQAAWMQTALMGMMAIVSLPVSRLADSPRFGRKGILLISMGVLGISTFCFGFIRSFYQGLFLRLLEGTFSGGTVVVRTMISEIVTGDKHRVKAFLMLPLAFNIGALVGPPIAGLLVAYAQSHASENEFLARWTYAPPMLMAGGIILAAFIAVFFLLEETLPALAGRPDTGIRTKKAIVSLWQNPKALIGMNKRYYEPLDTHDSVASQHLEPLLTEDDGEALEDGAERRSAHSPAHLPASGKLPLRKALTANVLVATSCQAMLDGIISGYNMLWPLFLSDPPAETDISSSPLWFSGGAGLTPSQIALTLTILAVAALPLQIFLYPRVSYKLKPIRTMRYFLWCPAMAFAIAPLIAITAKTPFVMWLIIVVVQLLMVLTAAMVVPSATLMVNNSAPSPAALAATHGLAVALSSVLRTLGPLAAGRVYAASKEHNNAGLAWWLMAATGSYIGLLSCFVRDGKPQHVTTPPAPDESGRQDANQDLK
ncbi:putative major facilitator superfamily transporter [Colletotrichum sublineola]|uniref:Putative major facilitator superfamily transporter n=1 Tax=Colletotrichum sublineola TaxID=1173701 RepID=A0A066XB56_COLSU|nr:putative major facilitator superfamily transporter [Colletotrichum sublineola]